MGVRFGRYELVRPLGRGGMAEVFLARYRGPEGFEKRLVIKRVLPSLSSDRRFLRLFFEEARLQVSLSHGNLVPVFDFGRVDNAYFIAMEHVPGRDLKAVLGRARERGERLTETEIAYIGAEVCRGLAYVHRRGLVHRDVSPRNVLVSLDGEVKLSDFGVAFAADRDLAPGIRGTVAYMAPEQARGERPDGRADLYALGMILAEAVLGRRVRPPAEPEATLEAARRGEAVVVPGPLGELVARATAPEPAARFPDAEAMRAALERVAAELGAGAARALAGRLQGWFPADEAEPELEHGEERPPGEETYFRDGGTAAETLAGDLGDEASPAPAEAPAAPPRRAGRWALAAGAVAALALTGMALVPRATTPTPAPPAAAATSPGPARPAAPPPEPTPPPEPARLTPPRRAAAPTPRRAPASGTVIVQCTPWCVPFVDGKARGEDGRRHTLTLPAGPHKLAARRLDDRQERTIEVAPGRSQAIAFTFE